MTSDGLNQGSVKKLGEQLRDIRVSAQAPVEQVETDLRIKAKYIIAMEDGDLKALPARVYTEGFVRNYAVYLGLDPAEASNRFFAEQDAPAPSKDSKAARKTKAGTTKADCLSGVASPKRSSGASVGRSIAALWPLVLLGGLGFGLYTGYGVARDAGLIPATLGGPTVTTAQKLSPESDSEEIAQAAKPSEAEAAPNESEVAAVEQPVLIGAESNDAERPDTLSYARADATPYWQAPPPDVEPVDGPVSEIKAETAGVIPDPDRWTETRDIAPTTSGADASRIAAAAREALSETLDMDNPELGGTDETASASQAQNPGSREINTAELSGFQSPNSVQSILPQRRFALHASADSWVKIQDSTGVTVYTGILSAGESYSIPDHAGLTLRTGNAGGLMFEIEGQRFGPLGSSGAVMNGVPLNPGAIRASFTLDRQARLTQ